ncbi:MAG: tyrosine-protein phosphatase [Parachlamydia sp.]|nr:tyrosine-protein phosphatase [Parachlamydia sp.]
MNKLCTMFLIMCSLFFLEASAKNLFDMGNVIGRLYPSVFKDEESGSFNPDLLYLLDKKQGVYLFRGDLPEIDQTFCYTSMIDSMRAYLANKGQILSDSVQLVDLSYLNKIAERSQIEIEKNWFSAHPDLGRLILYPLYGSLINPCDLDKSLRNYILTNHDVDGLKALMNQLKSLLEARYADDAIIYMHCNAGKDRTGEAAAAYLMQFQNYSYEAAVRLDLEIAQRSLRELSLNAIRWYAFYLRDIAHTGSIGLIEGK